MARSRGRGRGETADRRKRKEVEAWRGVKSVPMWPTCQRVATFNEWAYTPTRYSSVSGGPQPIRSEP